MRWAFSYWSQNSGSTISGLPKCSVSVTVLLPPCEITRSTCGITLVCGSICAPTMLSANADSIGLRPLADDEAVPGGAEHVDEALHEFDVGAAERTQREVDERAVVGPVGDLGGQLVFLVGLAHAGVHPGPAVVERPGVEVVGLGRIDVEVGAVGVRA